MFFPLFLLLTSLPVIELMVIFKIHDLWASIYGSGMAVLISIGSVILTGLFGAALARSQGLSVLRQLQQSSSAGRLPGKQLIEGVLILLGGVMLLTPGYITDIVGFLFILPGSRGLFCKLLMNWVTQKVAKGEVVFASNLGWSGQPSSQYRPGQPSSQYRSDQSGQVIDVPFTDNKTKK